MVEQESQALRFVRLCEEQLDDILEIEAEAYPEPWSRNMFRDEIRNERSYFYTVYLGDEIIGYGGFWLVLDEAHITSVAVKHSYRGRGFGRQMVSFLIGISKGVGARMATLEVRISNVAAQRLYEGFGFKPVGLRKRYYPKTDEDAIVMLNEFD